MPVYEYRCPTCAAIFELRRPMSESAMTATCPEGHDGARRLLSVFASVGAGSSPGSSSGGSDAPAGPCGGACACYPS